MNEQHKTDWNLESAEVGSPVLIEGGRYSGASRIATVFRTTARQVTLDDGSRWTRRGRAWGSTNDQWMSGPRARLILDLAAVQADVALEVAAVKLEDARRAIGNRFDHFINHLSLVEIEAVNAILDANKRAREQAKLEAGAEQVQPASQPQSDRR